MGTTFKKGDKIRATRRTESWSGVRIEKGEELIVGTSVRTGTPYRASGELVAGTPDQTRAYVVDPLHFEPVAEAPQWSDVAPGDTIVIRVKKTGEEVTTKAYAHLDFISGVGVLAFGRDSADFQDKFELVKVEKPKPQPPTTPGSHVTVPFQWESGVNHLFLLDSGKWASQTGLAFWPPEDVASKDFTVIHDAGKDSRWLSSRRGGLFKPQRTPCRGTGTSSRRVTGPWCPK